MTTPREEAERTQFYTDKQVEDRLKYGAGSLTELHVLQDLRDARQAVTARDAKIEDLQTKLTAHTTNEGALLAKVAELEGQLAAEKELNESIESDDSRMLASVHEALTEAGSTGWDWPADGVRHLRQERDRMRATMLEVAAVLDNWIALSGCAAMLRKAAG